MTQAIRHFPRNCLSAALLSASLILPAASHAVELIETIGDYQIVKVASSKVCFATYNGKSTKGKNASFATFKTIYGERWQVAGFVDHEELKANGELLSLSFDKQHIFSRGVEFSKGKFALPFTEDDDLENYTKLIESKTTMELTLRNLDDSIVVELSELGKARAAMDKCLEAFK